MRHALTAALALSISAASAQAGETFGVYTLTAPPGWARASKDGVLSFTRTGDTTYCRFELYAAQAGTGTLDGDFRAEWTSLVAKRLKVSGAPQTDAGADQNGWQNRVGGAAYTLDGTAGLAALSTYSGGGQVASILMLTNDEACLKQFDAFLGGLKLKAASAASTRPPGAASPVTGGLNTQPLKSGYAFDTTTFPDGWVSVVQKDWVLARKGGITVRLHYPNDALKGIYDSDKLLSAAWNTLVAPRYRDLQGYKQDFDTMNYFRPYLAAGSAVSAETGGRVYVALYHQDDSGWIEIVTPDQATFEKTFGVSVNRMDAVSTDAWTPLRNLRGLNRFAVAAGDLKGTWSSSTSGMTQWVSAVTGLSAGATSYSSNTTFDFGPGNRYHWEIATAGGVVGALKFQTAKSDGQFSVGGPWKVSFSNIENRPQAFDAYFEAGRGVRILWLNFGTAAKPSYSAFVRTK